METMRERIAQGKLFTDCCEGLEEDRIRAKKLQQEFNASMPDDMEKRARIIFEILGSEPNFWIEPPFFFAYGYNISLGTGVYINVNCSFIDDGKISVGRNTFFGPSVTVATSGHPIDPMLRSQGYIYAAPVEIGRNCWIGANCVICPGVHIGNNAVIGAGSVVTEDIPENVVAAGNPCKVIRKVGQQDREFYYKERPVEGADLRGLDRLSGRRF